MLARTAEACGCGSRCPASTTCGTRSPRWARWTPWVASSSPPLDALAEFAGVGRRFERLGEHGGVAIVDDYAHHPSELAATLAAARQAFPGRRLVAVFQPHLYSRTAAHGDAMGRGAGRGRPGHRHRDLRRAGAADRRRERPAGGRRGRPGRAPTRASSRPGPRWADGSTRRSGPAMWCSRSARRHHPRRSRAGAVAERRLKRRLAARSARSRLRGCCCLVRSRRRYALRTRWSSSGCDGWRSPDCSILTPAKVIAALKLAPHGQRLRRSRGRWQRGCARCRACWRRRSTPALPGTLVVEVEEAEPVALDPGGRRLALVDRAARSCPSIRCASAPDLPVAVGGRPAGGASCWRGCGSIDPGAVRADRRRLAGGPDDRASRWTGGGSGSGPRSRRRTSRAVTAVAQDLARRGGSIQELDGRFAGQVIVRRARRMSAQPQRLVAALDLGSTKVVAVIAEVTGDARDPGAKILASGSSGAPASGAAWCATSRRPPAPSPRR